MLITIYDKTGRKRATVSPSDSSTQTKEIQGDNVLSLSFTTYEHIDLDVDDYVEFEGERYWQTERYRPKQKSEREWEYDLKLYGVESMIKRLLVIKTVDGEDEPVFTLTAPPREHVAMIVRCMNNGMGNITDWKTGQVDGTENIVIDYFGKYCDEALKEIAEKVGAEWWVEGQTVNVCRCEHGEQIALGYRKGLLGLEADKADNVKFYTRLYPVGSSRNIDPDKYGFSRLQLPDSKKYVEINADKYGRVDHYEQDAFAGIYPRRIGKVSEVRFEEKTGEDGKPFKIYYFKDDDLAFDPNDYELGGMVKRVSFQEGSELAGLGDEDDGTYYFEVNFNSDTREFEIITIWPYDDDTQLPGDMLIPKKGDGYILWNIRMPDEYYRLAEEEFLTAVEKYNEENALDVSVFKSSTDHVWIEDGEVDLSIGRRVRLESEEYFPETGYRESRITKITRKVNLPSSMDIEIGDALSRTSMQKMNADLADAKNYVKAVGESVSLPDIIRTWDNTLPTDNNLFSARRSKREFLNKNERDRAKKHITFEEGIGIGAEENGGIDSEGNATLLTMIVKQLMSSPTFVDGIGGEGWRIWLENELSHLTIDKLTVRQVMTVFELLIEKVRSVGGQLCVSAANGKIKEILRGEQGEYRIKFEQANTFVAGDLMRCKTFTAGHDKHYWVLIDYVDREGYVWVDEREFLFNDYSLPEIGDECVLMGNINNKNRQNLILISATEDGQPRIDILDGVNNTNLAGCLRTRLGKLDGITDEAFPADNQPRGNGLYSDNAYLRGTFLLSTGEDVKTRFEVVEGRMESMIEAVRDDFVTNKGYLSNPSFASGMEKWNTANEAVFFLVGNKWIWANNNVLTKKGNCASVIKDAGRSVVRISGNYITQKNSNLRTKPQFETGNNGDKIAMPVYLSFFGKVIKGGTLKVEFTDVDKSGFENFNSFKVEEELATTEDYVQLTYDGLWNGTGDFKLSFSGEIRIYMLVLSTDKADALTYKYRTLFEQSEKLINIAAQNFDKDGNVLAESSITQTAENISLVVKKEMVDGLKKTGIDIESGEIGITADKVRFTNSEGEDQMLLENGKINVNAIDVDGITAKRVEVGESDGERITIIPEEKAITVYDEDGRPCQEFTGQSKTGGASDFFGDDSGGRVTMAEASGQKIVEANIHTISQNIKESGTVVLSETWTSATPMMAEIKNGMLRAEACSASVERSDDDTITIRPVAMANAIATAVLYLCEYTDEACTELAASYAIASCRASATTGAKTDDFDNVYPGETKASSTVCAGKYKKSASGGYFRLELYYALNATAAGSYAKVQWGTQASDTAGALSAEWKADNYVSYYFANGFCLGTRKDDYITAYRDSEGMNFIARRGTRGLRMSSEGVMQLVAEDLWTPIPVLLFRGIGQYTSTDNSYTIKRDSISFNGESPILMRSDRGRITANLPATWKSMLGDRLSESRMQVHVFGYDSLVKATIESISGTAIKIGLSDDSTYNDSNFILEISII